MANTQRVVCNSTTSGQQADENNRRTNSGKKLAGSHSDIIVPDDPASISNGKCASVQKPERIEPEASWAVMGGLRVDTGNGWARTFGSGELALQSVGGSRSMGMAFARV